MSSLKVFISSSVYVTIGPGTSSVVASPLFLVELCLAIFWAVFTGFLVFLLSRAKEVFYASPRICSLVRTRKNLRVTLKNAFVCF